MPEGVVPTDTAAGIRPGKWWKLFSRSLASKSFLQDSNWPGSGGAGFDVREEIRLDLLGFAREVLLDHGVARLAAIHRVVQLARWTDSRRQQCDLEQKDEDGLWGEFEAGRVTHSVYMSGWKLMGFKANDPRSVKARRVAKKAISYQ
jgi:hypothetical protein